ncbi:hypothetical protein Tco_1192526 [Tanacetum coccineum]
METIHVTFNELTTMASEQFGLGPGLQSMTPATTCSGLVPNLIPQQPFNLPNRDDWDRLFQPMFDEYFNPPIIDVSPILVAAAPRAVDTKAVKIAISPGIVLLFRLYHNKDCYISDLILNGEWSWNWSREVLGGRNTEALNLLLAEIGNVEVGYGNGVYIVMVLFLLPHRLNLSYRGLEIPLILCPVCNASVESTDHIFFSYDTAENVWHKIRNWIDVSLLHLCSNLDWIEWLEIWNASNVRRDRIWTKDHLIANMIGDPYRSVSMRTQLQTDAMWCYFDAFLIFVEPKNFKHEMTKPSWIDAMQEEIHEFKRLQVWELVPYTPMVEKNNLDEDLPRTPVDVTLYRGMIGSLMYLTSNRPDLIYAVCLCARYQAKPIEKHLNALTNYGFQFNKFPLYCDNKSAIALCCNNVQHSRAKHIDVRYYFIKEQVENRIAELYFVRTEYQLADIFTKPLPRERFNFLLEKLGMRSMSPKTLKCLTEEEDE